jgi:membrane protease YdiL (CAAX protease family)
VKGEINQRLNGGLIRGKFRIQLRGIAMKQLIKTIFINRWNQVRSGWKIGLILVVYVILISIWRVFFPTAISTDLGFNMVDTLILFGIIFVVLHWIDRKRLKDIGFTDIRRHFRGLGFGLVLGAVSIAVIFVVLAMSGQIVVKRADFNYDVWISLGNGLLLFALVGLKEEILSRGYCLFVFRQMRRLWLAVLLSSIFFTLFHATNPNLQVVGLLNIFLAALLFSFMTVKTGNLWMAIGFHITWNYFQGTVFGFPVSGIQLNSLYHIQIRYHNLLTGGLFGLEGGLPATGILLASFIVVWLYAKRWGMPTPEPTLESTREPSPEPPLEPLPAIEKPEKHQEYC